MELFNSLLRLFFDVFIRSTFISVPVIIIIWAIFKGKVQTQNALAIIKWLLISHTVLYIVQLVGEFGYSYFGGVEYMQYIIPARAVGSYAIFYWFMWVSVTLLPFSLLIKKLGRNAYFLFLVALLMNLGWLFELFVIHVTSLHRDYIPGVDAYLLYPVEISVLLEGVTCGVVAVVIGHFASKRRDKINVTG
ncbi:hypothetical protein [Mucilaginibacter sp.]|uniref:hypothetical protein n=1 Tax=Mucilaginibacter sp. TaxID=1882438 RepID=UPI0032655C5A